MQRTRQTQPTLRQEWHRPPRQWQTVPLILQPEGGPPRPISLLHRQLAPRSVVPAHSHGWGQLVYASQGLLDVLTPGGRYLVPSDRAVWVPPDEPHEVASLCGAVIASIYLTSAEAGAMPLHCQVLEVSPLLRELILAALRLPADYDWQGSDGRLFRTLRDQVAVARAAPLYLPLPQDPRLQNLCQQLQLQPAADLTLPQWGERVGASARTLQRLFERETGLSFQAWRQQLRLQLALQRLLEDRASVTEVAAEMGYDSSSAFIAMFQRQLGKSPGEYLKTVVPPP